MQLDKKGILWFLLITFAPTIVATLVLWIRGFSLAGEPSIIAQYVITGAMFFPGVAAFIVRKYISREGFADAGLKFGSWKSYLNVYLIIPAVFLLVYLMTGIFVGRPDFTLVLFSQKYALEVPLAALSIIIGVTLASLTVAPLVNSIPAFGEEFGWRGYLLPKLLPLGKIKALFLSGFIWGLWHIPFILFLGMHYGNNRFLGAVLFTVLVMLLGVYIGYLRLRSGSVILASFIHGVFNAQFFGIWGLIFPQINPLFGGMTGLIGIFALSLVAVWVTSNIMLNKA